MKRNLLELGLVLAPNKTVLLHFNNKNIKPGEKEITIYDHVIKSSATARFLGLIFDYRLTFTSQVQEIKKKCSRAINVIKYLCGTWWGSDPETLLILYKSLVRSVIDYGSIIYYPKQKKHRDILEKSPVFCY